MFHARPLCICVFISILLLYVIDDTKGECVLNLKDDFGMPSPVFIRNGRFLAPNRNELIALDDSESLVLACPGHNIVIANVSTNSHTLSARCVSGSTFRINKREVPLKQVKCTSQPWYNTELTTEKCKNNLKFYKLGYKVKNKLYSILKACFDQRLLSTAFVVHEIEPTSVYVQVVKRPKFTEGDLFNGVKMSALYHMKGQRDRLDAILGKGMGDQYLSKTQFLTRGHLAARADFTTSAETRATFHLVNTVPQWMRGNAGDWAALEEGLRRRVHDLGYPVTVYTGGHGVMTLPDVRGAMQDIYLHTDENNNGLVPVPMYNYKVVYNPKEKTAAAFITINSSFYNKTLTDNLQFCDDICEGDKRYSWLKWRPKDGTHSFCCDYNSFIEVVDYLPKIVVNGLFY